ncbi:hypothetical protein CWO91_16730 [Bradyrhizobium genosp. SA-3]|uniref:hypothetical protein n=1 Tax=Bradyrhizobium genosp. SA-3 TaxID=508868 RepID=UPI00102A1A8C|nr:hypothetical protein [Bradyrhizobium genosp. SA-3]RZN09673.1 hypothetical protein CWO91_16730 [Bradyrhizobium genosp. SA-3]
MPDVDDDTCITLAMLHGCQFHNVGDTDWYVHDDGDNLHPLELKRYDAWEKNMLHGRRHWCWASREELARDYCKFHGLI